MLELARAIETGIDIEAVIKPSAASHHCLAASGETAVELSESPTRDRDDTGASSVASVIYDALSNA